MAGIRIYLADFALANPIYSSATVTVFTVDPTTQKISSTLAPLYADPFTATLLANPQTLDGEGKWQMPVYVDQAVIMRVGNAGAANGDTGIAGQLGSFKGDWAPSTLYFTGDTIRDGAAGLNTSNVYYCVVPHTSGTFATDLAAAEWLLYVSAQSATAGIIAQAVAASLTAVGVAGYLTANQTITLSGAATGSGGTAITVAMVDTGVGAGTYTKLTVNGAGQATSGGSITSADIAAALGNLTNHALLLGSGAAAVRALAPVSAGYILIDGGAGADPSFVAPFFSSDSGNLSGSRALGTTYTNSSGKPMWVEVFLSATAINTTVTLTVAGRSRNQAATASNGFPLSVNGMVVAGATYSVAVNSGSATVNNWEETT